LAPVSGEFKLQQLQLLLSPEKAARRGIMSCACCAPEEKSLKIIDLLVTELHPCDGLNEGSKGIIIPKESCNQLYGHHVQESRYKEDFPWASLLEGSQSQRQRNRGSGSPQQEAKRPKGNLRRDKKRNRHVPVNDHIHAQGNTSPLVHAAEEDEVEMLTRLALQYDDEIMNAVATQFAVVGPDQNHFSSDMTNAMDPQIHGGRRTTAPTTHHRETAASEDCFQTYITRWRGCHFSQAKFVSEDYQAGM
jgi:hypothetical protein